MKNKYIKKLIAAISISISVITGLFAVDQETTYNLDVYSLKNGINVFLMPNTSNRVDFISLSVKGGIFYLDEEHAGLEKALFAMMASGSENYSLDDIKTHEFKTRAKINGSAGSLNASLSLNCIDYYFEESLPILLDCFLNPKFNENQWQVKLNNYRQSLQQEMNDPSSMMFYFADQMIYQNHPFNVKSTPTVESIHNLKLEDLEELHKKEMDPRRITVIAITNYDTKCLLDTLNNTIGKLKIPDTKLVNPFIPPLTELPEETLALTHPSCGDSGHIARAVIGEPVTGNDYMAFVLAQKIYEKIMYSVIRTKYGACYTPYITSYGNQANVCFEMIYRCSDFQNIKKYMREARDIMASGKVITGTNSDGTFILADLDSKLEGYKNTLINSTYDSQATTGGLANRIASGLYLFNNPHALDFRAQQIRNVKTEDILRVFKEYFINGPEFWISVSGE